MKRPTFSMSWRAVPRSASLPEGWYRDHAWEDIRLQERDEPDHRGSGDRMPEHRAEDRPERMGSFVRIVVAGGTGDHDGLSVDHLSHDAARRVGRDGQDRVQVKLVRGDPLQTAE